MWKQWRRLSFLLTMMMINQRLSTFWNAYKVFSHCSKLLSDDGSNGESEASTASRSSQGKYFLFRFQHLLHGDGIIIIISLLFTGLERLLDSKRGVGRGLQNSNHLLLWTESSERSSDILKFPWRYTVNQKCIYSRRHCSRWSDKRAE